MKAEPWYLLRLKEDPVRQAKKDIDKEGCKIRVNSQAIDRGADSNRRKYSPWSVD